MTSTAVVARDTGEVVEVKTFDFTAYLSQISGGPALAHQQELAKAYDAACRSLIGPNDVQKEGNREFKKKSAWRKLQRHFGISTAVVDVSKDWISVSSTRDEPLPGGLIPPLFVATVTVKATAPWGQSAEAVGACGSDEESGRRKITIADAIATAETRATNRAVSNLIAMGEVSAEEMSKGAKAPKGQKYVEDMTEAELLEARTKAENAKRPDVVERINLELERRRDADLSELPPELDK